MQLLVSLMLLLPCVTTAVDNISSVKVIDWYCHCKYDCHATVVAVAMCTGGAATHHCWCVSLRLLFFAFSFWHAPGRPVSLGSISPSDVAHENVV